MRRSALGWASTVWAGLRSQRVVRKKNVTGCRRLLKPLKRAVMTDAFAPRSQLRLWLIVVLFYLLWCNSFFLSVGSKASETVQTRTCPPTRMRTGLFCYSVHEWTGTYRRECISPVRLQYGGCRSSVTS